ncbi:hypothetical protein MKX01_030996 [Papaver californicum]|nr:hypothetical protein MKX01_030996 [Papaver californicum]
MGLLIQDINMAKDALALMGHLDLRIAHAFGHSMGSMIACKLAAMLLPKIGSNLNIQIARIKLYGDKFFVDQKT